MVFLVEEKKKRNEELFSHNSCIWNLNPYGFCILTFSLSSSLYSCLILYDSRLLWTRWYMLVEQVQINHVQCKRTEFTASWCRRQSHDRTLPHNLLFPLFFCLFVCFSYCFSSAVSSTPSRSQLTSEPFNFNQLCLLAVVPISQWVNYHELFQLNIIIYSRTIYLTLPSVLYNIKSNL